MGRGLLGQLGGVQVGGAQVPSGLSRKGTRQEESGVRAGADVTEEVPGRGGDSGDP